MSLRPDDRSSRGRSKSGTRDRSRSRSNVRTTKAPSPPSAVGSDSHYGYPSAGQPPTSVSMPGWPQDPATSAFEVRTPNAPPRDRPSYVPYPSDGGFTMGDYSDFPPHERPGYVPSPDERQYGGAPRGDSSDDDLAYGAPSPTHVRHPSHSSGYSQQPAYTAKLQDSNAQYRYAPQSQQPYQYAPAPDKITYTTKPQTSQQSASYTQTPQDGRQQLPRTYSQSGGSRSSKDARVVEIVPGGLDPHEDRRGSKSKSHRLSVSTQQTGLYAPPSPGLGPRMDRLSVSGNRPDLQFAGGAGGLPPASPLLEAYHGTYQSLSPMPGAMRLDDGDLDDLEPLSPGPVGNHRNDRLAQDSNAKKRVKVYDPESDAKALAEALNHHKIDGDAVCDVLPPLSHDQILELRKEYKKQVKIHGKGINLSKHIKLKLTGNFGKVAYVTALGRWESEGYWANFWYQSHSSRRELLIESLMGRTNAEIREIKDSFKDKRYNDSLTRCMEKELKMDKFRTAVLMALEGRRQEEQDTYPLEYRARDVDMLDKCLRAKEGGESAMLEIIVRRSEAHLREVLKEYQGRFGENFARAALKKSNNLVGEVIAHILNGVINKPSRDALLLHHAIKDIRDKNKDDELRYELLISRLVRLHWDRLHMNRVKREYHERYSKYLEEDIEDATKGDFREFLCELCQTQQTK